MKVFNLTGQKFGRLTVLSWQPSERGNNFWLCRCECGNVKIVKGYHLQDGHTRSCGCLQREKASETGKAIFKHGMRNTLIYETWKNMLNRCRNKNVRNYKDYGGRGIIVCERWLKFENFYEDMGDRPEGLTLERINNNGNYEPSNCKWATYQEQANNARSNVMIEYKGQCLNIAQWAKETGIAYQNLWRRLRVLNWPIEKALTQPTGD